RRALASFGREAGRAGNPRPRVYAFPPGLARWTQHSASDSAAGGRRCVQQRAWDGELQRAGGNVRPSWDGCEERDDATGTARRCEPPPLPALAALERAWAAQRPTRGRVPWLRRG